MNRKITEIFFPDEVKRVDLGLCPTCGEKIDANKFRNAISLKEFGQSGMCQKCQDEIFGED